MMTSGLCIVIIVIMLVASMTPGEGMEGVGCKALMDGTPKPILNARVNIQTEQTEDRQMETNMQTDRQRQAAYMVGSCRSIDKYG